WSTSVLAVFIYLILFFFFFSSRRRHTRWPRDWSSDVCSSDLRDLSDLRALRHPGTLHVVDVVQENPGQCLCPQIFSHPSGVLYRSEERRVGKECRYRWWP